MNDLREFTERELMDEYCYVVAVNYCNLQDLLSCINRIGYMSSIYGWDADVYEFEDTCIVTGYRPIGNLELSYDTAKKYESIARALREGNLNWETIKENLKNLLSIFCNEARGYMDEGYDRM